jgi:uncharacterized phage protein (TIGR01671 family)
MNRETKFRAWDPYRKLMFENVGLGPYRDRLIVYINSRQLPNDYDMESLFEGDYAYESDEYENLYATHLVVMQYTGLKDKNGKEVYERDIIQLPYVSPLGEIAGAGGVDERGKVVFAHGAFMLHMNFEPEARPMTSWIQRAKGNYVSNYGNTTIYDDKTLFEVIGNIYENPELLSEHAA